MRDLINNIVRQSNAALQMTRSACSGTRLNKALFVAIAFILIEPAWFNEYPTVDLVFIATKLVFMLFALALLAGSNHRTIVLLVVLYGAYLVGDTALHRGDTVAAVKHAVNALCFISLPLAMLEIQQDDAFEAFRITFEILLVCNLVTVVIAPEGLYQIVRSTGWTSNACWFLGIRNGMPPIYVTAACLEYAAVVRSGYEKRSILRCGVMLVLASLTIFLINNSTAQFNSTSSAGGFLVIWIMVLAVPVLQRFEIIKNVLNYAVAVSLNYLFAFLLVLVRVQNAFSFLIVDILGKDLTLSNRTNIWDAAINEVKGSLLSGFGIQPETTMASRLNSAAAVSTTHNGWLDMFYIGGIILAAIVLALFIYCGIVIAKQKCIADGSYLIGCYVGIYLFTGQTEALIGPRFFLLFALLIIMSRILASGNESGKTTIGHASDFHGL